MKKLNLVQMEIIFANGRYRKCAIGGVITYFAIGVGAGAGFMSGLVPGALYGAGAAFLAGVSAANSDGCFDD